MTEAMIVVLVLVILVVIIIAKTAVVVPQQSAYVVERLGKYANTLDAGFHILVPFIDTIRYRHSLKETAVDIPEQICITRDNVQVHVDGVLYSRFSIQSEPPMGWQIISLPLSSWRRPRCVAKGKIELDRTFEERTQINLNIVTELDKAT